MMTVEVCPECYWGAKKLCSNPQQIDIDRGTFTPCIDYIKYLEDLEQWKEEQEIIKERLELEAAAKESPQAAVGMSSPEAGELEASIIEEHIIKDTRERSVHGRALKPVDQVKQPARVGRQRANIVKPIKPGDICEWSELARAGGGVVPIMGCYRNAAQTVHHGPDKDYFNNTEENLHKICNTCHSLYHSRNDVYYVDERPEHGTPFYFKPEWVDLVTPHDPDTKADLGDILQQIADIKRKKISIDYEITDEESNKDPLDTDPPPVVY